MAVFGFLISNKERPIINNKYPPAAAMSLMPVSPRIGEMAEPAKTKKP